MQRKALVVGGTGLIGRFLVDYLLRDKEYDEVVVLTKKGIPATAFQIGQTNCGF